MSLFPPVAPLNLAFDRRIFALRRCAATVKQPCLTLMRCEANVGQTPASRRSANYQPNLWGDDRIRSLTLNSISKVEKEDNTRRIKLLKEKVRKVVHEEKEIMEEQILLIDQLQQLGVAYNFKDDIKDSLSSLHASLESISLKLKDNLHASAVLFRLLRENGFSVSEDILYKFRDERGQFRDCLKRNTQGMLSLYEASYYEKEEEMALHEAMEFTTEHLKNVLEQGSSDVTREKVAHALELPLNWRMKRLHTRWLIESCRREAATNVNHADDDLLEFAKLDFNATQSVYKIELREVSRWWTEVGIAGELTFSRDRLTENYLWTVGWAFEPEHWRFREEQTKANCFVTMIDDVYDIYGTLNELELFTDTIERWDINSIDRLPDYMKLLFLAVFNTTNEAAFKVMKDKGLDTMPYLKRAWADLCKAYLVEAKWYHKGHTPKLHEYLENGRMSISSNVMVTYAYCMAPELTKHDLERFSDYPAIMLPKSKLARLYDDLATSKDELKRGDVQKCIQCCMSERGVSEDVARRQMKEVIEENWRCVNGDRGAASPFEEYIKRVAIDMIRTFQFFYREEDGYGKADGETENQVMSLLINPIVI